MKTRMLFTNDPWKPLHDLIGGRSVLVVTDSNVAPLLPPTGLPAYVIEAGEEHKNLTTAARLWQTMTDRGLTRNSVVVNIGGGTVSDLGGFCAATFKRGIDYINVPTTILAAVDAAAGGKTGIDFGGLKNQIGVFRMPEAVVISDIMYSTLPRREQLSGYGEMLKHALLDGGAHLREILETEPDDVTLDLIERSAAVKTAVVEADPQERGIRRHLNLGHTVGHALEELALERGADLSHGCAVARGLVAELVYSRLYAGFPSEWLYAVAARVKELYGAGGIVCDDYPRLLDYMIHDKKNRGDGRIAVVTLAAPGMADVASATCEEISEVLDISRDLLQ